MMSTRRNPRGISAPARSVPQYGKKAKKTGKWAEKKPSRGKSSGLVRARFNYEIGNDYIEVETPFGLDLTLGPLVIEDVPVLVYWRESKFMPAVVIISGDDSMTPRSRVTGYDIQFERNSIACTIESFTAREKRGASLNNCYMTINVIGWTWIGADAGEAFAELRAGKISPEDMLDFLERFGTGIR